MLLFANVSTPQASKPLRQFGEEKVTKICEWNQTPAETFIRLNPLRPESVSWRENEVGLEAVGNGFYRCESFPREAVAKGLCYVQDPSTGMAPRLLDPQPGETVLDA